MSIVAENRSGDKSHRIVEIERATLADWVGPVAWSVHRWPD